MILPISACMTLLQCDLATHSSYKKRGGMFFLPMNLGFPGNSLDQENAFQQMLYDSRASGFRGLAASARTCWTLSQACCKGVQEERAHRERRSHPCQSGLTLGSRLLYEWALGRPSRGTTRPTHQLKRNDNSLSLSAGMVKVEIWDRASRTEIFFERLSWVRHLSKSFQYNNSWNPLNNLMG